MKTKRDKLYIYVFLGGVGIFRKYNFIWKELRTVKERKKNLIKVLIIQRRQE